MFEPIREGYVDLPDKTGEDGNLYLVQTEGEGKETREVRRWPWDRFVNFSCRAGHDEMLTAFNEVLKPLGVTFTGVNAGDDNYYFGVDTQQDFDWQESVIDVTTLPQSIRKQIIQHHAPGDVDVDDLTQADIDDIVTNHDLKRMSPRTVLETWLNYEGIIGYTSTLINLFTELQKHATRRNR